MEQIKVLKCEAKTTKNNKPYKALEVECAGEVRKVNMWSNYPDFSNVNEGSVITAKMVKDGNYWNLQPDEAQKPRGGASTAFKSAQIAEAQEKKAQSIAQAQDKSAWMWAKNNASTLLAADPGRINGMDKDEIIEWVIDLATKIYNSEPLEPF